MLWTRSKLAAVYQRQDDVHSLARRTNRLTAMCKISVRDDAEQGTYVCTENLLQGSM